MNVRNSLGFSLLELLIALALLAAIGAALASTTQTSVQVWKRTTSTDAQLEAIVLRGQLRRWIQDAKPPSRFGLAQEVSGSPSALSSSYCPYFWVKRWRAS